MTINKDALVEAAKKAMERAYCPYSKFQVGAALLTEDGTIITGGVQFNFLLHNDFITNEPIYNT